MEEVKECFQMLTGKPTEKRPLGKPKHRWENNIKMDRKEIGIRGKEPGWFGSE